MCRFGRFGPLGMRHSVRVDELEVQVYCDWCYSPLTQEARRRSRELGLDRERSWACESCLSAEAFAVAPDGWDTSEGPWPWRFHLSAADWGVLQNALNEVVNGPEAIEGWEFQTRMGVTPDRARDLLTRMRAREG